MSMRDELAELVGTFTLVFIGAGAGALAATNGSGLVGVALSNGSALVVIVYAWGSISGAHVNPAVTVGVWVAGKIDARRALSYTVFQPVGGVHAA